MFMISQAAHGVYKERPDVKTDHWQRTDCSRYAVQYKSNALKRPGLRWNRHCDGRRIPEAEMCDTNESLRDPSCINQAFVGAKGQV